MLRRSLLLVSSAGLSGAALAACGAPGTTQTGGQTGQPSGINGGKPVTLEYWGNPPPAEGKNFQMDVFDAFQRKYSNVKINYGATKTDGQGVDAVAAITAAIVAGTPPHFVRFDRFQSPAFAAKGVWVALDDLIKRDKYDIGRFAPLIVPEAKGITDGKWYALVQSTDDRLLYWNKEAFQEVGYDPEKPPTTWDELRQMAIKLTKRRGDGGFERVGFYTEYGQAHYHIFGWQNGGGFQTADGKKATLTDGKNQEALQWMVDLVKDVGGRDPIEDFRKGWGSNAQHPFLVGQVAMLYETNGLAGTVARYRPDMKFGAVQPPLRKAGDKPLTWSGGFAYNMVKGIKDTDAAWELMKFMVSEEGYAVGDEGDAARAKQTSGYFVPGMSGAPELDKKRYAKYKTGIAAVDRVPEIAVPLMQYSRVREPSIAAQNLWDGVKAAQAEAVSQKKGAKQALEDNQALIQKALDDAWTNAPK
ncbi:MAG TPA: extracellular solute-binding protein [Chloroflexota bacterium]|nr:extracellular solute-binding protein [Chloroflexota bacterium]